MSGHRKKLFQGQTLDTDLFVAEANTHIGELYAKDPRMVTDAYLHAIAVQLSKLNIGQKNGGPFGAVIVRYEHGLNAQGQGVGKPTVIGVGANHVFPNSDPSAHAEMEAYRDAAKRQGYSDLKGAVLFTSCECCPMCLSIANGAGIARISYVNTRAQAEAIEFSDKLQYDLFQRDAARHMTNAATLSDRQRADLTHKLGSHGAVVLDDKGMVYQVGDSGTRTDPTLLPSVAAIRNACKKVGSFCLPEGFTLLCKNMPHPAGLVTADWARILRKRDTANADNPAFDDKIPDPSRIIYLSDKPEELVVSDRHKGSYIRQQAEVTYQQPALPDEERAVRTDKFNGQVASLNPDGRAASVFSTWKAGTSVGDQTRY